MHTLEEQRTTPNPDVVFDHNRFHLGGLTRMPVKIGIHDADVPPDLHGAAYHHRLGNHDMHVAIEIGPFPDGEGGALVDLNPDAHVEATAFDDDLAAQVLY